MIKKDPVYGEYLAAAEFPKKMVIRQYEKGFIIKNLKEKTETRRDEPNGTDPALMAKVIGEVLGRGTQ